MRKRTHSIRDWPALSQPLVTVVTVWFNRQPYVSASIESLLRQDYANLKIIAVDDGSTDGTLEALRAIRDPRLEVRAQGNRGFTASLQHHIARSEGEVIAIHGSGDISSEARISTQVGVLQRHPDVGFVSSWYEDVDPTGTVVLKRRNLEGDAYRTLLQRNPFSHGTLMFRRDVWLRVGGYREVFTYAQDRDLLMRMSLVSHGRVLEELLYHRRLLPDGVANMREKRLLQRAFAALAVECGRERARVGFDTVDQFGAGALAFRPRSPMVSKWLAEFALRAIVERDYDAAEYYARLALAERRSVRTAALALFARTAQRSASLRRVLELLSAANARRRKTSP